MNIKSNNHYFQPMMDSSILLRDSELSLNNVLKALRISLSKTKPLKFQVWFRLNYQKLITVKIQMTILCLEIQYSVQNSRIECGTCQRMELTSGEVVLTRISGGSTAMVSAGSWIRPDQRCNGVFRISQDLVEELISITTSSKTTISETT